jgi:hypothetical protein
MRRVAAVSALGELAVESLLAWQRHGVQKMNLYQAAKVMNYLK